MKLSASERELCQKISFDQDVMILVKNMCPGALLRRLNVGTIENDGGDDYAEDFEPGNGLSVRAADDEDAEIWAEALEEVLPEGYLALCSEDSDAGQAEVAVLQSTDPYDLLRLKATNGENFGLTTRKIIERLEQWHDLYGLTLLGAAYDWVEFELEAIPSDSEDLVEELIQFCPELLTEGFDDLGEVLAEYAGEELPEEFEIFSDIDFTQPGAGRVAFKRSLDDGASIYLWWD